MPIAEQPMFPWKWNILFPKAGTSRISNLTLACEPCNRQKNTQTAEEFGYPDIQAQALKPLQDAALMNGHTVAVIHPAASHRLAGGR